MTAVDARLAEAAHHLGRRRTGVALGYLAPDGQVTTYGTGELRRPDGGTPDATTRFEIGSITKTFTALALARAIVAGTVRLDTPVGDLVPEVAGLGRSGTLVTLKHLATHTSGLPRVHISTVRGSIDMLRGLDPYRDHTEAALLTAVRDGRLRRTPGTGRPRYSNSGFGLLGIALARHAGTSYAELIRQEVTAPLSLTDTGTRAQADADQQARTADGHHRRRRRAPDWNLDALPGAGALLSTVTDQLTWARTHLRPPDGDLGTAIRLARSEHAHHIGLAWQRTFTADERSTRRDRLIWHSGGTGGYRAMLCLRPDVGDAAVVLTNQARGVTLAGMRLLGAAPGPAAD